MHHVQVLEKERMPKQRTATAFWEALYELWRLSWYETRPNQIVPRCVPVEEWLKAINQWRLDRIGDKVSTLTVEELIHVAGGLVKSRMASLRFQNSESATFSYSILTNAAVEIQAFLCLHVEDQRLRPGLPGSTDQLAALTLHEAQSASSKLRYVNLDPRLTQQHESRARLQLSAILKKMTGHKRKRKSL